MKWSICPQHRDDVAHFLVPSVHHGRGLQGKHSFQYTKQGVNPGDQDPLGAEGTSSGTLSLPLAVTFCSSSSAYPLSCYIREARQIRENLIKVGVWQHTFTRFFFCQRKLKGKTLGIQEWFIVLCESWK